MKCPHCNGEITGVTCHHCEAVVPEGSRYCMECGVLLLEADQEESYTDEFEDRVLCPDGTCTGIIVDGKCSECGLEPGKGEDPSAG